VFDVLQAALEPLGFTVHRMINGEAPDAPVENLFATRGSGGPHLGLCRPPRRGARPAAAGPATRSHPEMRGGLLYGRGAVDMKSASPPSSRAAAACRTSGHAQPDHHRRRGGARPSTAPARSWTGWRALDPPDMILIGEPTSERGSATS
jgi:succinyl-diaminopimelate desuccinylase